MLKLEADAGRRREDSSSASAGSRHAGAGQSSARWDDRLRPAEACTSGEMRVRPRLRPATPQERIHTRQRELTEYFVRLVDDDTQQ